MIGNMTRFHLSSSSNYEPEYRGTPPNPRLSYSEVGTPLYARIRGPESRESRSARLVTLSSDGQVTHTLIKGDKNDKSRYIIETLRLPIQTEEGGPENAAEGNQEPPSLVRTHLPDEICRALEIDPPIELVCVEGEASSSQSSTKKGTKELTLLCLYTRRNAFLLQIGYEKSSNMNTFVSSPTRYGTPKFGTLLSVQEPFERYLERSPKTTIIRIRPAPQRHADYVTVTPKGCMAALIYNKEMNEYYILLQHSNGTITTPAEWNGPEQVSDIEKTEGIVDFCFAQSAGLSIFPSLSILLLKGSGEVMAVSPILFDGTVVANAYIKEGLEFLQSTRQLLPSRENAKFRQYKAAEQYLLDVFQVTTSTNIESSRSLFRTAQIIARNKEETAAIWPVAIQGPLLLQNMDENAISSFAVTIEPFGSTDHFVGIAIGRSGYEVDFAVISPTSLIPRFGFESITDSYDLNDEQYKRGAIVEQVQLTNDTGSLASEDFSLVKLLADPIANHLLHYATSSFVGTISTNIMKITNRQVSNETITDPIRTTAWSSISSTSTSKAAVIGITVSSLANLGHLLITRLSDASIEQVNVTESQYRHELESIVKEENISALIPVSSEPSTTPLHEKIGPLSSQIIAGIANFSKIVGTETSYRDIHPGALGVAVSLRERCDKEVVLPLLELKTIVDNRRSQLKSTIESQKKQLNHLNKLVNVMRDKMGALTAQYEKSVQNAESLSDRSEDLLKAANSLLPTVTKAENEYFQDIQRLERKVAALQRSTELLKSHATTRCLSFDVANVTEGLSQFAKSDLDTANRILKGESALIDGSMKIVNEKYALLKNIREKSGSIAR